MYKKMISLTAIMAMIVTLVMPAALPPQPLQQVVHGIFRLGRREQQALGVAEHAVAERQDKRGEFGFLHCICKTKLKGKTQQCKSKYRNFFTETIPGLYIGVKKIEKI